MRIRITCRGVMTSIGGAGRGEVVEVPDAEARYLIGLRRAAPATASAPASKPDPAPAPPPAAAPEAPKPRGRKRKAEGDAEA